MYSVELYRRLQATEHPPGWVECGGIQLASSPGAAGGDPPADQLGAHLRPAAAGDLARRGRTSCSRSIDTDGVVGGCLPAPRTARSTRRSSCYALAAGRARRRRPDRTRTPGCIGIDTERRRPGDAGAHRPGRHRVRGRRRLRRHVRRRDRAGWSASGCRSCRCRTSTSSPSAFLRRRRRRAPLPTPARPRPARLLPAGGRRPGDGRLRARPRAVDRRRATRTTRSRRTSTAGCCPRTGTRFEEIAANAQRRVPAMADVGVRKVDQRSGGVHAGQRVLPRARPRSDGFFVAAGFCAHGIAGRGRHRQGDGRVDRRRRARPGRLAHGHPPVRPRSTARRRTPWRARWRPTQTYYDIVYPDHEREAGRPLRTSPAYALARRARRGVRREGGLGAGQLLREQRGDAGDEALRPRGWAGRLLVAGDRRRAPRDPRGGRPVRRVVVRQDRRSAGRTRRRFLEWVCDNRGRARRSATSPTPRRSTAAAASSATSPSRGSAERRVPGRHRHRLRLARPRLAATAGPAARRRRAASPTSPASTSASRCGGRAPARSCGR